MPTPGEHKTVQVRITDQWRITNGELGIKNSNFRQLHTDISGNRGERIK